VIKDRVFFQEISPTFVDDCSNTAGLNHWTQKRKKSPAIDGLREHFQLFCAALCGV